MLPKTFIISFLLLFTLNSTKAQQECPQFEWVKPIKMSLWADHLNKRMYGGVGNFKTLQDRDGNYIIVAPLPVVANSSLIVEINDNIIPIQNKVKEAGLKLFIAKLDQNLKLIWHNSLILAYDSLPISHANINLIGLCLDSKGNVYISGEASGGSSKYTLSIDNHSFLLGKDPTHNYSVRDGFLLKLNRTNGNAFWLKKLDGIRPVEMQMSQNDSLYLPFITIKDTIKFDNQIIANASQCGLAKLDALGAVQWTLWGNNSESLYKNYIGSTVPLITNIIYNHRSVFALDEQEQVYIFGLNDSSVTKVSPSGQILWERKFPKYTENEQGINIRYSNNGNIYMALPLYPHPTVPNPYDFGNGDTVQIAYYGSTFLWEMRANTGATISVGKLWDNSIKNYCISHSLTADQNGFLYLAGTMNGKDSVELGDSVFYITPITHPDSDSFGRDAFVSKILPPAEGMGSAKYIWTIRSKGTGDEIIKVAQSAANGQQHYFYGNGGRGNLQLVNYNFADTFYPTGNPLTSNVENEVTAFFGKINTDCSLPTEEIANPLQLVTIYPNPAHSQITITNLPQNSTIHITDISGRVLYTAYNKQNSTAQIPLNGISNGMYFVQIINGVSKENRKVVISR